MSVKVSHEGKRGCGWRKVGALYLVGSDLSASCGRLPIPLETCPCCGHGFKPARGWTWVDAERLISACAGKQCNETAKTCSFCIIDQIITARQTDDMSRAGLLWIGEEFYPSAKHFEQEAAEMGVSRRINSVPHGFKLGETWVLLAHRNAIPEFKDGKLEFHPGIFRVWKPVAIEIIVSGDEPDDVILDYEKRGLPPVKVVREQEPETKPMWSSDAWT